LLLERRSLIVLSDEARYDWEHGIAARKKDA
jgi:alkylated DNA repair dioxygenase AlkB